MSGIPLGRCESCPASVHPALWLHGQHRVQRRGRPSCGNLLEAGRREQGLVLGPRSFATLGTGQHVQDACICAQRGPDLSSDNSFSAISTPPPEGNAANTLASNVAIFSADQSCRIRPSVQIAGGGAGRERNRRQPSSRDRRHPMPRSSRELSAAPRADQTPRPSFQGSTGKRQWPDAPSPPPDRPTSNGPRSKADTTSGELITPKPCMPSNRASLLHRERNARKSARPSRRPAASGASPREPRLPVRTTVSTSHRSNTGCTPSSAGGCWFVRYA